MLSILEGVRVCVVGLFVEDQDYVLRILGFARGPSVFRSLFGISLFRSWTLHGKPWVLLLEILFMRFPITFGGSDG